MTRPLIVWGGVAFLPFEGQKRFIVAAATKKRAVEMVDEVSRGKFSIGQLNKYWSKTGNAVELAVATEEGVWCCDDGRRTPETMNYVRLYPRKEG